MRKFIFIALITTIISACNKEIINDQIDMQDSTELESEGVMVLGEKLENPYSVQNMTAALEALKDEISLKSTSDSLEFVNVEVKTTHLYVRFLPKDSLELKQLESDSLILFDYPLDYEIKEDGEYYHDPSIPEGEITWQYTTVNVDYQFRDITYEVLEDCFIMDDQENTESELKSTQVDAWALLENKAMNMTNNLTEDEKADQEQQSQLKGLFSGWLPKLEYPCGYIKVYDTEVGDYMPVKGLTVRVHRLVKISYGITDENGYYKVHKGFRYNCFYGLRFESSTGVKLWRWLTTLTYARYSLGVHDESGYSHNISTSSVAWRLATVMNGVYEYYNIICPKYNITKPYSNLRISVTNGEKGGAPLLRHVYHPFGASSNSAFISFVINQGIGVSGSILSYTSKYLQPDIMIGAGSDNTATVYTQTAHELAHASHFTKVGSAFWAKYISYILTYSKKDNTYGDGTGNNADLCALGEMWGYHMGYQAVIDKYGSTNSANRSSSVEGFKPKEAPYSSSSNYSDWIPKGLLWDLIDTNQDVINTITDKAYGFTNEQFFNALDSDVKSPQDFRDRLIKENEDKQKTEVDELFKAYYWN